MQLDGPRALRFPAGVSVASHYQLVRLANGIQSIRSLREGETFHPVIGPSAEAEALYVRQLGLPSRMAAEPDEFVIWDVGLGGGANVLTVLDRTRQAPGRLKVVSFDYTVEPLAFAIDHADALGYVGRYAAQAQELIRRGTVEFSDGGRSIRWELALGDFPTLVNTLKPGDLPAPHAILFDAYSPARNPAMWTLPLFANLYRQLDPHRPCALPTYSRSTLLRVTLLLAGFHVGVGHATGEKEETTIASNHRDLIREPLGKEWLRRAEVSTSAEPLRNAVYQQLPLTPESLSRLRAHPQFQCSVPGADQAPVVAAAARPATGSQ